MSGCQPQSHGAGTDPETKVKQIEMHQPRWLLQSFALNFTYFCLFFACTHLKCVLVQHTQRKGPHAHYLLLFLACEIWVLVAINVAIVLNQIVLTRAIPTNSQVSSNKRSYVTYNTGSSKIQSVLVIVHCVRGVHTMSDSYDDSYTPDIMNNIHINKCRILKNKTMIWQLDLMTSNYDHQVGPCFSKLQWGKTILTWTELFLSVSQRDQDIRRSSKQPEPHLSCIKVPD